jgi:multiple sugar transport system permease protein
VCILAPYTWLIISSISQRIDLTTVPLRWLPKQVNLQNYREIFEEMLPAARIGT